jgi:hypothetical protein
MNDPDNPPAPIAALVHQAERLRMELLDALRRAPSPGERGAVLTEMMLLFGQAFAAVQVSLPDPFAADPPTVKVMHECVCGRAIYRVWLNSETPISPWEDYERLTAHWAKVTGWVLMEGD